MHLLKYISYVRSLSFLGFLVLILPFLGFPRSWKDVILVIIGALLLFLSYELKVLGRGPVEPMN